MNYVDNWLNLLKESENTLDRFLDKPYKNFDKFYQYFLHELLVFENSDKKHYFIYEKLLSRLIQETKIFINSVKKYYDKKLKVETLSKDFEVLRDFEVLKIIFKKIYNQYVKNFNVQESFLDYKTIKKTLNKINIYKRKDFPKRNWKEIIINKNKIETNELVYVLFKFMDNAFKNNNYNLNISTQKPKPYSALAVLKNVFLKTIGEDNNNNYLTVYLMKPSRFNIFSFYFKEICYYATIILENNEIEEHIKEEILKKENLQIFHLLDLFVKFNKKELNQKKNNLIKLVYYHNLSDNNIYINSFKNMLYENITNNEYIIDELHKYIFYHHREWDTEWEMGYDLFESNFYELLYLFSNSNNKNLKEIARKILLKGFDTSNVLDEKRLNITLYLIEIAGLNWREMNQRWIDNFSNNYKDFLILWDKAYLSGKLEEKLDKKNKVIKI